MNDTLTLLFQLMLVGAVIGGGWAIADEWQWRRDLARRMARRLKRWERRE